MTLSAHFDLSEFTESDTAHRKGIKNVPSDAVISNLAILCEDILEPLREEVGPITITSGFRCLELNRQLGSNDTSHHVQGRAADIKVKGMTPLEVCRAIIELELPFEQLIDEGSWAHVAIPLNGNPPRRELLTAMFGGPKVIYKPGIRR